MKLVLVTGGAGYIGSHTCLELLEANREVVVVDNLCNADRESLNRVRKIAGGSLTFVECDVRDRERLEAIFAAHEVEAVIHFAGLKSVEESVARPDLYRDNNVNGSIALTDAMAAHGVYDIVFSSSATVYGDLNAPPVDETCPAVPTNPYGETKLEVERHLHRLCESDRRWNCISLRYFNPAGAHGSGRIGEDPAGIPDNLTPYITQVAAGKLQQLSIWGNDWPTPDGTGVRDYIHVVDLARGHLKALEVLEESPGELIVNLGTGRPYSVLEVHAAFERAVGKPIPYRIEGRRNGDIASMYANPARAKEVLGWEAALDMDAMARDAWRWQRRNPDGYR